MNKHLPPPHVDLLAEILAFCERTGTAKTTFGKVAVGDASFIANLEAGREPRWGTMQRVREYMAARPESAA